jgi:hypothetical protein
MHCRGLNETVKLLCMLAHDMGRRTKNSGVCVPTIEGETYYGQLTDDVQILILASARIVCNIVYVQVRDRIHRELCCKN